MHARSVANTVAFIAASVTLAACTPSLAQRAFDRGEFGSAAKLADDDVKARPGDEGAVALRARAREREVELACTSVETSLRDGRGGPALDRLGQLLTEVDDWGGAERLSPALGARITMVTAKAKTFVTRLVDAETQPLAAEAALAHGTPVTLHRELTRARDEAHDRVKLAGLKNCARLRGLTPPETPAWNLVVTRYCAHFGQGDAPPLTSPPAATSCERASYTVEQAASCVSAGFAPANALAVVATTLGERAELVRAVVGPPATDERR
ncbi:MAG: hypothetical protein JWM82_3610 [Myxococcales bacterium]|nr:hypothetical protein [Myxococcales bacterium]